MDEAVEWTEVAVARNLMPSGSTMGLELKIWQFEQNPELRFSKVRHRSKAPFERDWLHRPYSFAQINEHRRRYSNYGVLCGYGGLAVSDADQVDLAKAMTASLPPTFTVRTGGGGMHFYYLCPEVHRRIVLERDGIHYGEIQSFGQQVVGPGSTHPNGRRYEITRDISIQAVAYEKLIAAITPFMRPPRPQPTTRIGLRRFGRHAFLDSIAITTVIDVAQFKRASNGELYGPNPWHGSTTGMNTWVNEEKNVGYCFRHACGISVVKAVALNEGIIGECDARLSLAQFHSVLKFTRAKYGQ